MNINYGKLEVTPLVIKPTSKLPIFEIEATKEITIQQWLGFW